MFLFDSEIVRNLSKYYRKKFRMNTLTKFARLRNASIYCKNVRYNYTMPERYHNSFYHANSQLFECVNYYLHTAYEVVYKDLVNDLRKKNCNYLMDVHIPIKMNNGTYNVCRGFRAHHGLFHLQRPCLGGFRMCCDVSKDHVKALAVLSTYKNACVNVNMAGAHGALQIPKSDFNEDEIKRTLESYRNEMTKTTYDITDVYEPDMYCNPKELAWLKSNRMETKTKLCVVKEDDYLDMMGISPFLILKYLMNDETLMTKIGLKVGLKDKTFICDGLGKMGVSVSKYLEEAGVGCIGFREIDSFTHDTNGVSVKDLVDYKKKFGSFKGYNDRITRTESQASVLTKESDILILSSSHKILNCYVAEQVQAKIILECASLAITPTAHKILIGRNHLVIPDILSTAGLSLMNYLNYVNRFRPGKNLNLMERTLRENIRKILTRKTSDVGRISKDNAENTIFVTENILNDVVENVLEIMNKYKLKLDLRTATYIYSIKNLFNCIFDTNKY